MTYIKGTFTLTRGSAADDSEWTVDSPTWHCVRQDSDNTSKNTCVVKKDQKSQLSEQEKAQANSQSPDEDSLYDTDLDSDDDIHKSDIEIIKTRYISDCEKHAVQPSSVFINIIESRDQNLSLCYASLNSIDVKVMVPFLRSLRFITELNLSGNGFGSGGAIHLSEFIKKSPSINVLNLSDNNIGQKGCEAICNSLRACKTIKSLFLDGNGLDDKCDSMLAALLSSSQSLVHLTLSNNLFESVAAAQSFSTVLAANEILESFDISYNHFQPKATAALIGFLAKNHTLRSLNLSHSSFGLDASKAFSLTMKEKQSQLEELDLSSNLIDDECAKYLGQVLAINESMRKLVLIKNPLGVQGFLALLKPLQTMPMSQMEVIDLRDMYVKSEDLLTLFNYLEERFDKLVIRRGERID